MKKILGKIHFPDKESIWYFTKIQLATIVTMLLAKNCLFGTPEECLDTALTIVSKVGM